MEQNVPKHWCIQFRCWGITQKKECNIQNMQSGSYLPAIHLDVWLHLSAARQLIWEIPQTPFFASLTHLFGWSGIHAPTFSAATLSRDLVHQPTGLPNTFFQNHVPPDLPDLHFLFLFTLTLAQNVLLRCFSAECFVPAPIHHHLPWYAQSHVTPYTCTLFLPSAGSSTTLLPLMTDENSWTLAVVVQ
jgi:hypothetical protein